MKKSYSLMLEMAYSGQDHGHFRTITIIYGFLVPDRSARLYDSGNTSLICNLNTVREGEKGIGSHDSTLQIKSKIPGFFKLDMALILFTSVLFVVGFEQNRCHHRDNSESHKQRCQQRKGNGQR